MTERTRNRAGAKTIPPPPAPKEPAKTTISEEASRLQKLEETRKQLFELISRYREFLGDYTLPENKTATAKELESRVALETSKLAWDLNFQNLDEGTMTVVSLLLHSLLLTRDEINKLKFQNAYLAKQVSSLKQQVSSVTAPAKSSDEPKQ